MTSTRNSTSTIILITNDGMGHADQTLQRILIGKYLSLMTDILEAQWKADKAITI